MVLFCQVIDDVSGMAHRQHHQRGDGEVSAPASIVLYRLLSPFGTHAYECMRTTNGCNLSCYICMHTYIDSQHLIIPSSPSSGSRLSADSTTFIPINMITPINNKYKYKSPTSTHSHLASPTSALDVPTCVPANNNFQSKVKGCRIQTRSHSDSPVNTPRRGYRGGVSTNNSSNYGGSAFAPPPPTEKYKTELCKNFNKPGGCKFGNGCHYIHSEKERRSTDIMPKRPCSILTSTGHW